jgi:hypothetical protein
MIAQQTIIAGAITLKIIGLIIFGLGNDYSVRMMTHADYDIFVVAGTKFPDQKNISMFIMFRAHNGYYDMMIIKDTRKNDVYSGPIEFMRVLGYDVRGDRVHDFTINVNVTSGSVIKTQN